MFAKRTFRKLINILGYDIYRLGLAAGNPLYELIRPVATYSPWNKDKSFLETFRAVQEHTLVDKYRCFELWSLVEQTGKLEGSLIEIGVWRGGTGALIAKKASLCGISAPVYLCDTFTGVVKASDKDTHYTGGEHSDSSREIVEKLLNQLRLTNVKILEGVFPDGTAHLIEQETFRFCHVDVDTYRSAKDIVEWIWDKTVVGGVVVFDDYGFLGCEGITKYVEEQFSMDDRLIMHNLNGHAIVVKIKKTEPV
jgi:O-methyltransferase